MKLRQLFEVEKNQFLYKAVFLMGGPGSGKTFFKNKMLYSFKSINPDNAREFLTKKAGIPGDQKKQTPEQREAHGKIMAKGTSIAAKQHKLFTSKGYPIALDTTGKDVGFIRERKETLESKGYETKMIFVKTPLKVAQERNLKRDRKMLPKDVKEYHDKVNANIDAFKDMFGNDFIEADNSGDKNDWSGVWKKIASWIVKPNAASRKAQTNEAEKILSSIIVESKYDFKVLKKNRMPLSKEERDEVMERDAVWHHGPHGEKTPAVWKTKNKAGDILYICNTHRAAQVKSTLKGAINSYKFIKTTA